MLASHFDLEYVLGHKIAFLCVARGNPRPHITWFKDGAEIYTHHYLHVSINSECIKNINLFVLKERYLSLKKFSSVNKLIRIYNQ